MDPHERAPVAAPPTPTRLLCLDEPGARWRPRPRSALEAELAEVTRHDVVLIVGRQPSSSPHLLEVIRGVRGAGAVAWLASVPGLLARPERCAALANAGLSGWAVQVRAHPAPGDPERAARAEALAAGIEVALVTAEPPEPACWAFAEGERAGLLWLRSLTEAAPVAPDAATDAAIDDFFAEGARRGLPVQVAGWTTPWTAAVTRSPAPSTAAVVASALHGFVPASARHGTLGAAAWPDARRLAARGAPALDLPPCHDGVATAQPQTSARQPACEGCPATACHGAPAGVIVKGPRLSWSPLPPQARVCVIAPADTDPWWATSALPALVHALTARGARARLATAWHVAWHPTDLGATVPRVQRWRQPDRPALPPRDRLAHPAWFTEPPARKTEVDRALWDSLDLFNLDLIVVPGLHHAARLRTRARIVALDDGRRADLHAGVEVRSDRPDEVDVLSALTASGDLRWAPAPLHLAHHAASTSAARCRDLVRLDDAVPVRRAFDDARALLLLPTDPPDQALRAVGRAHAASRPVVAPATAWGRSAVRHGVDGLLYDPSAGPAAAVDALTDAEVARLATGALRSAHSASVERLADQLLHGAPPLGFTLDPAAATPWRPW